MHRKPPNTEKIASKIMKPLILFCVLFHTVTAEDGYSKEIPGYNPFGHYNHDGINGDEIPGEAGRDYPVYSKVPGTSFSCNNQRYPGYYADPEAQCQVFHICQENGRGASFLCPNGTIFNQQFLVCDWWYNFDCGLAQQFYNVNELVLRAMKEAEERLNKQRALQQHFNSFNPHSDAGYGFDRPDQSYGQNHNDPDKLYFSSK